MPERQPGLTKSIEAMCIAALGMYNTGSTGRELVVDELLDELCRDSPGSAVVVASVLQAIGDSRMIHLGNAVLARVGEMSQASEVNVDRFRLDFLILCVKDTEFKACLNVFGVPLGTAPTVLGDSELWTTYQHGLSVGIALVGTDGNVEAAIEVGKISVLVDFSAAILVGMAAGVPGEVDLGDVVVATSVLSYEFQRLTKEGPKFRPKSYSYGQRILQKVAALPQVDPGWSERVCSELLQSSAYLPTPESEPVKLGDNWRAKVVPGVVLAGSRLIEDDSLPEMRDTFNDRVVAAEMEGAGFALACDGARVPWLVVRGIADFGEDNRRKSWQYPASFAAAAFVRDKVLTGNVPLLPRS